MSLRDDLIAAKALINTPKKLDRLGITGALAAARQERSSYAPSVAALRRAGIVGNSFRNHPMVMSAFDRAIAASPDIPNTAKEGSDT